MEKYKKLKIIGKGTFGKVYLVETISLPYSTYFYD